MRALVIAFLFLVSHSAAICSSSPAIVSRIHRDPVASSAIAAVGYSKKLHALEIEFRNGAIYRYLGVPPQIYRELLEVPSKASYYDTKIRKHYRSIHVRARE